MGYFRMTFKCSNCGHQWGSFFASFNMTHGDYDCPKCKTKNLMFRDDEVKEDVPETPTDEVSG